MRKIKVKRLAYYHLGTGATTYGGETYDGDLTDANILGSIFTRGKHQWVLNGEYDAMYQYADENTVQYRIYVVPFYQYEKTAFDLMKDTIKRILGL